MKTCLSLGAWGEVSPDVDWLLTQAASAGSLRDRSALSAARTDDARDALKWVLQRRWGMTALRANARLLLGRLAYVGRGAATAVERRETARHEFLARLRTSAHWARRGPRVWRGRQ